MKNENLMIKINTHTHTHIKKATKTARTSETPIETNSTFREALRRDFNERYLSSRKPQIRVIIILLFSLRYAKKKKNEKK